MKIIFSMLLTAAMLLNSMPLMAFAEGDSCTCTEACNESTTECAVCAEDITKCEQRVFAVTDGEGTKYFNLFYKATEEAETKENCTLSLMKNAATNGYAINRGTYTLDLNGYALTSGLTIFDATIVVKNGSIGSEDYGISVSAGSTVTIGKDLAVVGNCVTVDKGTAILEDGVNWEGFQFFLNNSDTEYNPIDIVIPEGYVLLNSDYNVVDHTAEGQLTNDYYIVGLQNVSYYPVWLSGKQLSSAYHEGEGWSYNDGVLTLNNFTNAEGLYKDTVIYAESDLKIQLKGDNVIANSSAETAFAVRDNLEIMGNSKKDTLSISTGYYCIGSDRFRDAVASISNCTMNLACDDCGIYYSGTVEIKNSDITSSGVTAGKLNILNSEVTTEGPDSRESYGLAAIHGLNIERSTVIATSEYGSRMSGGICGYYGDISIKDSTVTASGNMVGIFMLESDALKLSDSTLTVNGKIMAVYSEAETPLEMNYSAAGYEWKLAEDGEVYNSATQPLTYFDVEQPVTYNGEPYLHIKSLKVDPPVVDNSNNNDDDDDEEPTYRTSIEKTENGSVSVNTKNPVKAEKVTITAKPDKGYEVESVIVTDKNGNEVKVTDNGDGTYSFRQPSSKVTIKVNFVKEAAKVEAPVKANPETGAPNHYFACR